jgi:hypothetical protein
MAGQTEAERDEEIELYVHAFSRKAFEVARRFVQGEEPGALIQQAAELRARLPGVAARGREASEAYRPDLNNTLSEARLDLDYVLYGGGRSSSIRLAHIIAEQAGR